MHITLEKLRKIRAHRDFGIMTVVFLNITLNCSYSIIPHRFKNILPKITPLSPALAVRDEIR